MSVFGDFQRVWVQRFPDSALPAAWEEDVRANLVKHKQKVRIYAIIPFGGSKEIFVRETRYDNLRLTFVRKLCVYDIWEEREGERKKEGKRAKINVRN